MKNFSLIDINDYFKPYNGAPRLDKFSFRKDIYKKPDQSDEEKLLKAYNRNKPVSKEDVADGMDDQHETNFHPKEHEKVQNMKPFIKQMFKDMKNHTTSFEL